MYNAKDSLIIVDEFDDAIVKNCYENKDNIDNLYNLDVHTDLECIDEEDVVDYMNIESVTYNFSRLN